MAMKKFIEYYNSKDREHVYNVISLEFSDTEMNELVSRPSIVDQLDWVTLAYPTNIRDIQNNDAKRYPKVQKYCLISVGGSYTSFHIDFGGTSVWYHVLKGRKVFWLIEPTEINLELFKKWSLQVNQDDNFFGDQVEKCQRIILKEGHTFMMPSGWIHAVYTPINSLVFGGNFLHSYNVKTQLRVSELEDELKVKQESLFPLVNELKWFVVEKYVRCLGGKSFLKGSLKTEATKVNGAISLCDFEAEGLSQLLGHLDKSKSNDFVEGISDLSKLHGAAVKLLKGNENSVAPLGSIGSIGTADGKNGATRKTTLGKRTTRGSSDSQLKNNEKNVVKIKRGNEVKSRSK